MLFESFGAKSCAIDFQTENVLALNKKPNVNWMFLFLSIAKILLVWNSMTHDQALEVQIASFRLG